MAWNNMATIAMEQGLINENTLRFIRIGYPLLVVQANILSFRDNQEFCLLKKYIHRLVTGDQPDSKNPMAYVKDRLEAFSLLSLDNELYDVASRFYDELIIEGKIHDSPKGALAGAAPKNDPALSRIRSSRQGETCLFVDPFSGDIYGQKVSELSFRTLGEVVAAHEKDICLPILPEYIGRPEELEALINQKNFSFENCTEEFMTARLQAQNMPHGARGVELLQSDTTPAVEVLWRPYRLSWQKTENRDEFLLYSNTENTPIDLFPINSPGHKALHTFLRQLFQTQYYSKVSYSLTDSVEIPLTQGGGRLEKNVQMDANGNYQVSLTDSQLALICMAEAEEVVSTLKLVTEGAGIITTREAGRLVRFSLTPEQLAICQKVRSDPQCRYGCALPLLQKAADQGNREAIFHLANCTFMGRGMEPDMEKAFALYQKASDAKHFWATFYLGYCLVNGYGTEADPQAAIACLKTLPPNALCYPAALHNIAAAYLQEKDYHTAAEILHQVEQGSFITAFTAYSLGYLYASGLGVEKNLEEAAKRYLFAANLGHIPGKYALAKCYIEGNGVKKDTSEARKLLQQILQPLPEERLFFFGSAPFISYPNLVYAPQDLEKRRELVKTIQSLAQKALSTL